MKRKHYLIALSLLTFLLLVFYLSQHLKKPKPNIILISIDTLRADHLGCYGSKKATSPHIDNLSSESIVFEKAFSQSSVTTPSHGSMLTSLYPLSHGVLQNETPFAFSEDITMLQQILKKSNFRTTAFTGGGYVSAVQGFNRGFDFWSEGQFLKSHLPQVKKWLHQNKSESFFLFLHFYDVHSPYILREDFNEMYFDLDYIKRETERVKAILNEEKKPTLEKLTQLSDDDLIRMWISTWIDESMNQFKRKMVREFDDSIKRKWNSLKREWRTFPDYTKQLRSLKDSYDAGIRYSDHLLGEFFDFLKSKDLWDNSMIIVTSDHGEEFMEHDLLGHGQNLYDTLLHVPLIIKMPQSFNCSPRRISSLTESIDIMPTVLHALDIKFKSQMQGDSLLPLMKNQSESGKEIIFASLDTSRSVEKRMIRSSNWKYIYEYNSSGKDEYYDIDNDVLEQSNLVDTKSSDLDQLKLLIEVHITDSIRRFCDLYSKNRKSRKNIPQEYLQRQLEALRALGYVN